MGHRESLTYEFIYKVYCIMRDDPLEEVMATHFSILALRIPWTEKPGGLQSIGSLRVDMTETTEQAH